MGGWSLVLQVARTILAAAAIAGACAGAKAAPGRLTLLAFADYVDPGVLEAFSAQSGFEVVYETYAAQETLDARLAKGGYDVLVAPADALGRLVAAGLLRPLDFAQIPNAAGLDPLLVSRLSAFDPGPRHAVPYLWFSTGLAFDAGKAAAVGEPPSWEAALRADRLAAFADCGAQGLESAPEMFSIALRWLRLDPASTRPLDLRRAADVLAPLRRVAARSGALDAEDALASGEICLAVTTSLSATRAARRAKEAENGVELRFAIPKEGAPMTIDVLAIPARAPSPQAALAFVNFLLRPQIAARNANLTRLANAVPASKPFVAPELVGDPAIFPPPETMATLYAAPPPDAGAREALAREWARTAGEGGVSGNFRPRR